MHVGQEQEKEDQGCVLFYMHVGQKQEEDRTCWRLLAQLPHLAVGARSLFQLWVQHKRTQWVVARDAQRPLDLGTYNKNMRPLLLSLSLSLSLWVPNSSTMHGCPSFAQNFVPGKDLYFKQRGHCHIVPDFCRLKLPLASSALLMSSLAICSATVGDSSTCGALAPVLPSGAAANESLGPPATALRSDLYLVNGPCKSSSMDSSECVTVNAEHKVQMTL